MAWYLPPRPGPRSNGASRRHIRAVSPRDSTPIAAGGYPGACLLIVFSSSSSASSAASSSFARSRMSSLSILGSIFTPLFGTRVSGPGLCSRSWMSITGVSMCSSSSWSGGSASSFLICGYWAMCSLRGRHAQLFPGCLCLLLDRTPLVGGRGRIACSERGGGFLPHGLHAFEFSLGALGLFAFHVADLSFDLLQALRHFRAQLFPFVRSRGHLRLLGDHRFIERGHVGIEGLRVVENRPVFFPGEVFLHRGKFALHGLQ